MKLYEQIPTIEPFALGTYASFPLDEKIFNYLMKTAPQFMKEMSVDYTYLHQILDQGLEAQGISHTQMCIYHRLERQGRIDMILNEKFIDTDKIVYSDNLEGMISTLEKYDSSVPSEDLRHIGLCGLHKLFSNMMFTVLKGNRSYSVSRVKFMKMMQVIIDIFNAPSVSLKSDSVLARRLEQAIHEFVETATWANQHNIMFYWKASAGHFRKGDMTRWETILKNKGERI